MKKETKNPLETKVESLEKDVKTLKKALTLMQQHVTKMQVGYKRLADQNVTLRGELRAAQVTTRALERKLQYVER